MTTQQDYWIAGYYKLLTFSMLTRLHNIARLREIQSSSRNYEAQSVFSQRLKVRVTGIMSHNHFRLIIMSAIKTHVAPVCLRRLSWRLFYWVDKVYSFFMSFSFIFCWEHTCKLLRVKVWIINIKCNAKWTGYCIIVVVNS